MTELMQQLQQWGTQGRYDFEGKRFRCIYFWCDESQINDLTQRPNLYGFDLGDLDALALIPLVLDGTIQVRRPVEHYPLPISRKYHAEYIQGFESNDEDILVFVADPQGDFMTVTTLFYRIEDIVTFKLTDKIGATFPFNAKSIEKITHWQHLPQPPQKEGE